MRILLVAAFFLPLLLPAQICNPSGNLMIFSNYEGGVLNINVDQNIPNLRLGICTYEAVEINVSGPFAGNVTGVIYAGFNSPGNTNCGGTTPTTVLNGVPASLFTLYSSTTNNIAQATHLGEPFFPGFPPLVNCMTGAEGTCNSSNQGGGNSAPQIVQFFLSEFGPGTALRGHVIDYSCFTGTYNISAGGNCCLEAPTTPPNPIYTGGSTYNFITATDTNLCAGPVTIDLSFYQVLVQPPAYTGYVWSNGATGPVVTFSQPGTYSFTVSDYCHGAWSYFLTDTIVIEACCVAPPAPLLSGDTTYCAGEIPTALLATAQNGGPLTWYSDAALSQVVASGNSFVPPSATGSYVFYVTESNGPCVSPARSISVNIFPNPIADAGPAQRLCEGGPGVSLSGSGGQTYVWSPAAPLSNAGIASPLATPAASTLFTLTVTDANGCSDSDTVSVTVIRRPLAAAGDDLVVCEGGSVQLSASGGSQYSWSPAFGLSNSLIPNPIASPPVTTQYVVTVTQDGCPDTDTVNVRVEPAPRLQVGGPYEICEGESVLLEAGGAVSYSWSPADGLSNPAIATPLAFPQVSTRYLLTGRSAAGCEALDTAEVQVLSVPETRISGESEVCRWQELRLSATGGTSFRWSTGATGPEISLFPMADMWVYAVAANGRCEGNIDSVWVRVRQPQAAFSVPAASGYAPFTVQPVNTSTEADTWLWLYEPSQRRTEKNPELIFQAPGEYLLTLVAYDNQGCSDTATQQILVEGVTLFVPSGFTPNGDSFNDLFQIGHYGIADIDIRIFNRWGVTVFQSGDPGFSWDGTSGGQRCPEGVYVYVIRARGENGRTYTREGSITLIR